jgi:hypothetical protein
MVGEAGGGVFLAPETPPALQNPRSSRPADPRARLSTTPPAWRAGQTLFPHLIARRAMSGAR